MQNIIIFKSHFYPLSETFIRNQVDYVKEFFIVYLVAERFTAERQHDNGNIKKLLNPYEIKFRRLLSKIAETLLIQNLGYLANSR